MVKAYRALEYPDIYPSFAQSKGAKDRKCFP